MTVLERLSAKSRSLPASRNKARAGRVVSAALATVGANPVVRATMADGSRLALDARSRTESDPLWNGRYEPSFVAVLLALIDTFGPGFLDVGANVGLIAVPVARRGGHVDCVEPVPVNAERLRRNLAVNGLTDAVVHEVALGEEAGTVSILRESRRRGVTGNAVLESAAPRGYDARFEVSLRRLDDLVAEGSVRAPAVVKMDVEGSEVGVLRGGRRTFNESRPVVMGEFNNNLMPAFGTTFLDAMDALPDGYAVFQLGGPGEIVEREPEPRLGDVLLIPDEKVAQLPLRIRRG